MMIDEEFKDLPGFSCGDVSASVQSCNRCRYIEIDVRQALNVTEARKLRDWLNEVLP
jgi:hypothetical protein